MKPQCPTHTHTQFWEQLFVPTYKTTHDKHSPHFTILVPHICSFFFLSLCNPWLLTNNLQLQYSWHNSVVIYVGNISTSLYLQFYTLPVYFYPFMHKCPALLPVCSLRVCINYIFTVSNQINHIFQSMPNIFSLYVKVSKYYVSWNNLFIFSDISQFNTMKNTQWCYIHTHINEVPIIIRMHA
jgi:hypothetical protein